ncbi:EF-hand domain-containing protein [Thermoactinospora rubra]|uniref:EF-hand domain-containing protein n=1 Tax=Thermoactinospora rubra TaxID=1088767 RepID=UPI0013020687|nr:EF-hand domain-containing protein [Thermoactinospora rubra]
MATQVQERKLARHFELLDYDRDGYIEQSDLKAFAERICQAGQVEPTSPEGRAVVQQAERLWQALQRAHDKNGDQAVSRQEFVDCAESEQVLKQAIQLGVAAFDVMDRDDDDRISMQEWLSLDRSLGVNAADSEEGFRRLDRDGDGHISKKEFTKGVEEFYRSSNSAAPGNWTFGRF